MVRKLTACSKCGGTDGLVKGRCLECRNAHQREWRAKNPEAAKASQAKYKSSMKGRTSRRRLHLETKYGLSLEQFDQMLAEQHGLCGLCALPMAARDIAVDHCHATGKVRALLHRKCNVALGGLGDDFVVVQRAAAYLHRHQPQTLIHPLAIIGDPPEHRGWREGQFMFFPDIAPTAKINAFVTVDAGLTRATRIGERVFCMTKTHVGHDAQVGDDCELAPGTVIGGHAVLGQGVRCGMNVTVKPFVRVGAGARLGMGAVVISDVPAGEVWAGNPAHRLRPRWEAHWDTATEKIGWEEVAAHDHGDYPG